MHQSIPSANIPGQPPGFCTYLQPRFRGFVPSELPGGRTYYESTKLTVDAAWSHFQLKTDLPSIAALWLQNLFQSWEKTLKLLSMVLKLKLEGMTKE